MNFLFYGIKYVLYSWRVESDIRLVQPNTTLWFGTGCKASGQRLEDTSFEWIFWVTKLCFVTWKVYSKSVVTLLDLAEEGRSGMFLFDCCPADWPMSKTVRGCYSYVPKSYRYFVGIWIMDLDPKEIDPNPNQKILNT